MKRREALAGISGSVTAALSGCLTSLGGGCAGETWTGLEYEIRLDEIAYRESTDRWEGTCSLRTSLTFVHESNPGIEDAGVALYSRSGHLLGIVPFGDVTWEQVPESNRSEMSCGGNEEGGVTRRGDFSVPELPHYLGLWYANIRAGDVEAQQVLRHRGHPRGDDDVTPDQWVSVTPASPDSFPPVPDRNPELGGGVESAELVSFARGCASDGVVVRNSHCCDVQIAGYIESSDPAFVPALRGVRLRDDEESAEVVVGVREYRRPPAVSCDPAFLRYTAGITFSDAEPTAFEVVHLDASGDELDRETVTRD